MGGVFCFLDLGASSLIWRACDFKANSSMADTRTLTGGKGATGASKSRSNGGAEDDEGAGSVRRKSAGSEFVGVGSESSKSARHTRSCWLVMLVAAPAAAAPGLAKSGALIAARARFFVQSTPALCV